MLKYFKKGKSAFNPNEDPYDVCPYKINSFEYDEWLEGWLDAEYTYDQEEKSKWEDISLTCPWYYEELCLGINKKCTKDNCAVFYFRNLK